LGGLQALKSHDRTRGVNKKVLRPSLRKEMAKQAIHDHRVTVRLACQTFKISETCYRYDPKLSSENELIADWLLRLTTTHKQWSFGLCFMYLRNTKRL